MKLYIVMIEQESRSGDILYEVAEIHDDEERANHNIDRFNKLAADNWHNYFRPNACLYTLELNKEMNFETLEQTWKSIDK